MTKLRAPCLWILLGLSPPAAWAQSEATAADQDVPPAALEAIPVLPLADAPAPAPVPEASMPNPVKLDEVVVTVTKRAQAVRNIPSSIEVLKGEKLEKLGIRKLKDIFALVPGVNMQDEIGGLQRKISVRGAGPDTGTNQTVGSVFGDIPISDPYGSATIVDPNPWDMSTVEILKGPQGSLFGATSLAGLIRYVPNYPKLGEWEGKSFYEYAMQERGSSEPSLGAAVNVPVGDSLAFRASGIFQKTPGLIDSNNPARQQEDVDTGQSWNGRVMGLWQPTEKFTVNAWYTQEERRKDDLSIVTFADASFAREDAPTASPIINGYRLGTLDLRYAFDWATLVSLTGHQQKEADTDIDTSYLVQPLARAGVSFLRTVQRVQTEGLLQELRLVSPDDRRFTWVAGAYYSRFNASIRGRLLVANPALTPVLSAIPLDQLGALLPLPLLSTVLPLIGTDGVAASDNGYDPLKAEERALYGEANYDFTDEFRLTLGSRLYRTSVNGVMIARGATASNNGASPGTSEKGWSPKAALTYRPSRDLMLYGTVSRGFQFGGFNLPTLPRPDVPLSFKSSSLWNYELGFRSDWFQRKLRFDITAFFLDWKNPQISQKTDDGVGLYVDNVGGSHNIGFEGTFRWKTPLRGLTVEQTAAYIEARTSTPFTDSSGNEIPEGTTFPSSPFVQAVTTLSYSRELGGFLGQIALINSHQGKSYTNIAHTTAVGDYNLLGATVSLGRNELPGATLSVSVNNILNAEELAAGFGPAPGESAPLNTTVADSSYVYTPPRSVVLRLALEF